MELPEWFHPPRPVASALAWLLGYFYLPCPRCGQPFAGWEMGDGGVITERWSNEDGTVGGFKSTGWCWRCPSEREISPDCIDTIESIDEHGFGRVVKVLASQGANRRSDSP